MVKLANIFLIEITFIAKIITRQFLGLQPKKNMSKNQAWLRLTQEEALEPELPICDPHHHLWEYPSNRYLLEEYLEDTDSGHNIISSVFVECLSLIHI